MARADLLAELVRFGVDGNRAKFVKVAESIAAEERAKNHTILAEKLEGMLRTSSNGNGGGHVLEQRISGLLHEIMPELSLQDLVLSDDVHTIVREFIEEHHRMELLRSYNLEPRNRLLFVGPPGNGKTSLAEAIAKELYAPLFVVRYDGVIGTYLGETAVRLNRVLEYIRTRRCVLFFDEFETLGKERGDRHETGEIKRVVSSLLMQIDALPSHVVVVGATNHPELLDRAVWRRFQARIELPAPTHAGLIDWFNRFEARIKVSLEHDLHMLVDKLKGASYAEVEEFGQGIWRHYVLSQPAANMKKIVTQHLQNWGKKTAKSTPQQDVVKSKPNGRATNTAPKKKAVKPKSANKSNKTKKPIKKAVRKKTTKKKAKPSKPKTKKR